MATETISKNILESINANGERVITTIIDITSVQSVAKIGNEISGMVDAEIQVDPNLTVCNCLNCVLQLVAKATQNRKLNRNNNDINDVNDL